MRDRPPFKPTKAWAHLTGCHGPPEQEQAAITLDELNARFLPLPDAERDGRALRGLIWLAAMEALVHLPERPEKKAVIDHLVQAADLSCELLAAAPAI